MKVASKSGFTKLVALLLVLTVAVGMVPLSTGVVSAENSSSDSVEAPAGMDLSVTLCGYDEDGSAYYYQSDQWLRGDLNVDITGIVTGEVAHAYCKKHSDDAWQEIGATTEVIGGDSDSVSAASDEDDSAGAPVQDEETANGEEPDADAEPTTAEPAAEALAEPAAPPVYRLHAQFDVQENNGAYSGGYDFKYILQDGTDRGFTNLFTANFDNRVDQLDIETNLVPGEYVDKAVFTGTFADKDSGPESLEVTYGGKTKTIEPKEDGSFSFEIAEDFSGDVTFVATDKAGNTKEATVSDVMVDHTAPTVYFHKIPEEGWTSKSVSFTVSAVDKGSGVDKICYFLVKDGETPSVEGADIVSMEPDTAGNAKFTISAQKLGGYSGTAVVFAVDKAGNSSFDESKLLCVSVQIDCHRCIISELSAEPNGWTDGKVTINGKITDADSGVKEGSVQYYCYPEGGKKGDPKPVEGVTIDKDGTASFTLELDGKAMEEGVYDVTFIAADLAGNGVKGDIGVDTCPLKVKIQHSAPEAAADSIRTDCGFPDEEGKLYTNGKITVKGTVTDTKSGICTGDVTYCRADRADDESAWTPADVNEDGKGTGKYTYSFTLDPRTYTGKYLIRVKNQAGVALGEPLETPVLHMDKTVPLFDLSSIKIPTGWGNSAVISGKVTDEGGAGIKSVSYRLNDTDSWIPIEDVTLSDEGNTAAFSFTLENTDYRGKIRLRCEDNARGADKETGNFTVTLTNQEVALDIFAPALSDITTDYAADTWTNGTVVINGTVADTLGENHSGVDKVLYTFDDGTGESEPREASLTLNEDGSCAYAITIDAQEFSVAAGKAGGFFGKVKLYARDKAANVTKNAKELDLQIDTEKGTAAIIQKPTGWTKDDLVIQVEYIDANQGTPISSGLDTITYTDDFGQETVLELSQLRAEGNKLTVTIPVRNYKGSYSFVFKDKAGNLTLRNADDQAIVIEAEQDKEDPVIASVKVDPSGKWSTSQVTVSGTAADTAAAPLDFNSGIAKVEYKLPAEDDTAWRAVDAFTPDDTAKTAAFSFTVKEANYNGVYQLRCLDNAGRYSQVRETETVQLDTTDPYFLKKPAHTNTDWTSGAVEITGSVADNRNSADGKTDGKFNSGIAGVEYRKTGTVLWTPVTDLKYNEETGAYDFSVTIDPQEYFGSYDFRCTDKAGRGKISVTALLRQDNVPPTLTVSDVSSSIFWKIADALTFYVFNFEQSKHNDLKYTLHISDAYSGIDAGSLTMICAPARDDGTVDEDHPQTFTVIGNTEQLSNVTLHEDQKVDGVLKKATVTFTVKENVKGNLRFTVEDLADKANSAAYRNDAANVIVDSISPERTVTYQKPVAYVSKTGEKVTFDKDVTDAEITADGTLYYEAQPMKLVFDVTEANFYGEDINNEDLAAEGDHNLPNRANCQLTVTKNGESAAVSPEWKDEAGDHHKATLELKDAGEYVVKMTYRDRALNKMQEFTSAKIVLSDVKPSVAITYSSDDFTEVDGRDYFGKKEDPTARTATVTIRDPYFNQADAEVTVSAKHYEMTTDADGKVTAAEADLANAFHISSSWKKLEEGVYTKTITFKKEANFDVSASYTDYYSRKATDAKKLAIDTTAPKLVSTVFDTPVTQRVLDGVTFGYYNAAVNVMMTYFDEVAGVSKFTGSGILANSDTLPDKLRKYVNEEINKAFNLDDRAEGTDFTTTNGLTDISFVIPEDELAQLFAASKEYGFDGFIQVNATDRSGNTLTTDQVADPAKDGNAYEFILDKKAPGVEIALNEPKRVEGGVAYYNGDIHGDIALDETNFNASVLDSEHLSLQITEDDLLNIVYPYNFGEGTWKNKDGDPETDIRVNSFAISEQGRYAYTFNYMDPSGNAAAPVTQNGLVIDKTAPTGSVTPSEPDYPTPAARPKADSEKWYYKDSVTLALRIEEHNFNAADVHFSVDGAEIEALTKPAAWTSDGDVRTATYTIETEGVHSYSLSYADLATNPMETVSGMNLVVDRTAPVGTVTPTPFNRQETIGGVLYTYFKGDITLDLKIVETNFNAADVRFVVDGTPTAVTWSDDGDTHTAQYVISDEGVHSYSLDYADLATNPMATISDKDLVIDKTPPKGKITRTHEVRKETIDGTEYCYFNGDIQLALEIEEHNFLVSDVKFVVDGKETPITWSSSNDLHTASYTITGDGVHSYSLDYTDLATNPMATVSDSNLVIDTVKPVGSYQMTEPKRITDSSKYFDGNIDLALTIVEHNFLASEVHFLADGAEVPLTWSSNGDTRTAHYTFTAEAVHRFTLDYADPATNVMDTVTDTRELVIDLTDPVVDVKYSSDNYTREVDGRQYFDHTRRADVTIYEHNFYEDGVSFAIDHINADGNTVDNAYTVGSWQHSGDSHTISISYSSDANYTFDVECDDLAKRTIKDYTQDVFTVDTVNPETISYTFGTSLLERAINGITFGFYNAQVQVDISCYDATSGVYEFDYEGILASDASSSNAAVVKTAIESAQITRNGGTATATFYIPQSALSSINQFNGTVTAGAQDRSGNSTETANDRRLVIDNVNPEAKVTANAAVQTAEGKDFYNGDITLTVEITEANFYAEDVDFKVDSSAVSLSFSDSGDVHTATYTVSAEGEHSYSLDYTDRSENKLTTITNERPLVIDRTRPAISIDKSIKNQSANKDETISFVLTVTDKYFTSSDISPKLTKNVVVQDKGDSTDPSQYISRLEKQEVKLDSPAKSGESYVYTIDNLDTDGFYQFECTAKDYASNANSKITCTDSDDKEEEVEEFDFSVNRNGSAFWVDINNAENDSYTNSNDISVILHEVNVDETVEGSALKVINDDEVKTVTLDKSNYQGNVSAGNAGWYESSYTLDNSNFEKDSRYEVTLTTRDKAGNVNMSSESDTSIVNFTVDRTAPVISSNVSSNQIIKSSGYDVEANIVEDNLDDDSLSVTIDNEPVEFEQEGKMVRFHFDSGTHDITIKASDLAGNDAEDYVITSLTVSDNPIVLWFANKPLFFATTGGAAALIALIIFLIARKSKKAAK